MTRASETRQARTASVAVRACRRPFGQAAAGILAAALWLLAIAPAAMAGPPSHPRAAALDLTGGPTDPGASHPAQPFNRACGTAVDSKGDVYVASAGKGAIDVFGPTHEYLTTIANANEPCGLAVNTKGELFVSEQGTGNVVRYKPNAYPFTGTPTYGTAEPIDSSGEAQGISVDPFDDRLYVAKGGRVDTYSPDGTLGIDEVQRVFPFDAVGGFYRLSFEGSPPSAPIPYVTTAAVVRERLEELTTIDPGDVSVTNPGEALESELHFVRFTGKFAHEDVVSLVGDGSELIPHPAASEASALVAETVKGFSGHIGEGDLTEATGVAAYTYRIQSDKRTRYLYAADADGDEIEVFSGVDVRALKLRRTITGVDHDGDPKTPEQNLGFGAGGAYLAADPGNRSGDGCAKVGGQACTAGHFLVYDDAHNAVDEFDASGEFLDQLTNAAFADAEPTGLAVERSGTANDGTIYVTAGAGPGAKLLAFGPLVTPDRAPLPSPLSRVLTAARAVAVDSFGNVYVAAGPAIHIFGPGGNELTEIEDARVPYDLSVDSEGNVYVLDGAAKQQQMTYYSPQGGVHPPVSGTTYARHEPPLIPSQATATLEGVTVNPADDHVFVLWGEGGSSPISEFGSAAEDSPAQGECGKDFSSTPFRRDIGVYGATGYVYVAENPGRLYAIDCGANELVREMKGAGGCPSGQIGANFSIAIDQSNGHVLEFAPDQPGDTAREYDASGACVAEFGTFAASAINQYDLAIDNSGGPSDGNVYVAFDGNDNDKQPFDVSAFGPLSYGAAPVAATGIANGLGAGGATLNGTVDPRGFELEACRFEYLSEAQYLSDGKSFANAIAKPCAETSAQIGKGTKAVSVHTALSGLDLDSRHRFRLVAENKYGQSEGQAGLFGPPIVSTETALPILYDEATLRAQVDPSGLATKYRFDYGTSTAYGQSSPTLTLTPGEGSVAIEAPLTGLAEGATYHFRIVVENEAKSVEGPDQTLVTQQRAIGQDCPNTEYRTGLSAKLPECRAYELVTPAQTLAVAASGPPSPGYIFNNWLVSPRGAGAGESLAFFSGPLPGFEGSGDTDGYRAQRGAGAHPKEGWATELYGPSYAQLGGASGKNQEGVASDQRYWLFQRAGEIFPSPLPVGQYLRTPDGEANPECNTNGDDFQAEFELVGCGRLGTDPGAQSRFVSAGGAHLLFFSRAHLEEDAAPQGTQAIYDRQAGEDSAEVVSVKPDGSPFGAGEDATYVGTTENGSAVVFEVGGVLYLHRESESTAVANAPFTFAGISEDGVRVFYMDATYSNDPPPATLYACDTQAAPCAGPSAQAPTEIAQDAVFVNVSADGSRVLFSSENALSGAEENDNGETAQADEPNLYLWDGAETSFVAVLHPKDLLSFGSVGGENMLKWTTAINPGPGIGRAQSPTRATPDGSVFVFQSHAQLSAYENEGVTEIYRYEPAAEAGERLACVSCDPSGAPPSGEALLQTSAKTHETTILPNLTDDGQAVFFHSPDSLLPEDANSTLDVYEWRAKGAGEGDEECRRGGGCLALISSGQGEAPNYLYGMSADGRDVFFITPEKLVGADIPGSSSIYDARVGGGIPNLPPKAPCQGDACQGQGAAPPALPSPASMAKAGNDSVQKATPRPRCPKGKRKVRSKGKVRCVKRPKNRQKSAKRANHQRRAGR